MANYKSQFTGEQIDEAIGKVLNAPNIYNYDGTVIIEKAESVLGLRRFKETVEPIASLEYDTSNEEQSDSLYEQYGFEITPLTTNRGSILGLSCVLFETSYSTQVMLFKEETVDGVFVDIAEFDSLSNMGLTEFEIISTPNTTVDEWLLANTEGVSV